MAKTKCPLEEDEQIAFVDWLAAKGLPFSAIPNSTYSNSWGVKMRNKRMGVRPGIPDLLVAIEGKCLIWVEMKRQRGTYPTEEQRRWIKIFNSIPNVEARVCNGCQKAIEFIEEIL